MTPRWLACMWVLAISIAIEEYTAYEKAFNNLPDVSHILPNLTHISDETVRNMTALHMYMCPTIPLCTANKQTEPGIENATDKTCCSKCECDKDCIESGRCCVDYLETKPEHYHNADYLYECMTVMYHDAYSHEELVNAVHVTDINFNTQVRMISRCPNGNSFNIRANTWRCSKSYRAHWLREEDYRRGTPVTDKHDMKSYANMYCAMCHGLAEDDLIIWTPSVQGSIHHAYAKYTLQDIVKLVEKNTRELNIIFVPPEDVPKDTYTCVVSKCNETGNWMDYDGFVEQACLYYSTNYRDFGVRYRNMFCAICNGIDVGPDECIPELNNVTFLDPRATFISTYNVSALDPSPAQQQHYFENKDERCQHGYIWDEVSEVCRELSCSFYYQLVLDKCQPVYTQLRGGFAFLGHGFYQINEQVTFSAITVMNMYNTFETETRETISRIFRNAHALPIHTTLSWAAAIDLVYTQIAKNVFELVDTKILGFSYIYEFYLSPNNLKTLLDLKDIQHAYQELLNETTTFGNYMYYYYDTLSFLLTQTHSTVDNHALSSKIDSDMNGLENMLYSQTDNSFANVSRQSHSTLPTTQQSHLTYPSTQQSHSTFPTTQQSHSPFSLTQPSHSTFPSTQQSHLTFPSTQQSRSIFPTTQRSHSTFPRTQQSHPPFSPTQQSHSTFPSTKQSHSTLSQTQQSHSPFSPTQQSHSTFPSTKQSHSTLSQTQQSHSPFSPTQQSHSTFPSTKQSHSTLSPTQQSHSTFSNTDYGFNKEYNNDFSIEYGQDNTGPSQDIHAPKNGPEPGRNNDAPFETITHKVSNFMQYPNHESTPQVYHYMSLGNRPFCTHVMFMEDEFLLKDNYFVIQRLNLTLSQNQAEFCTPKFHSLCICLNDFELAVRQLLPVANDLNKDMVNILNGVSSMFYNATVICLFITWILLI